MLGESPHVGWVPDPFTDGQRLPRYRWMRTEDLVYPAQDSIPGEKWQGFSIIVGPNGLPIAKEPSYHMVRQYSSEDTWCIAKWDNPVPRDEWVRRYGYELQWPQRGMWLVTDLVFEVGVEPTEALTLEVVEALAASSPLNFNDYVNISQGQIDAQERDMRSVTDGLIDNACSLYDAVPGKRGGPVSWGGIESTESKGA